AHGERSVLTTTFPNRSSLEFGRRACEAAWRVRSARCMGELEAVRGEFVVEAGEMLDRLERDLIELETNPSSPETLASLFRSLHTVKGAAGFMGLPKLGK